MSASRCRRRRDDGHERAGPVLLHLHRRVEHVQRARLLQPIHQRPEELRVHVVDLALDHDDALGASRRVRLADQDSRSTFGCPCEVRGRRRRSRSGSTRIAGSGPNARRVVGDEQRAGRRHQLAGDAAGVHRHALEQPRRRRAPAPETSPCAHCTVPLPTLSGDDDDVVDAEPLHAVHGADDVDDRIERADLVQVDSLDRHVVDRGLGLGEPVEQLHRAILACPRQRRALDEAARSPSGCDACPAVMARARDRAVMLMVVIVAVIV